MSENTRNPQGPTPSVGPIVLSASRLSKTFGATVALDCLDFDLRRGESVAIMGPSASGKSTLLRTLAGIELPDAGTVYFRDPAGSVPPADLAFLGESARSRLRRGSFGSVVQSGLLIPELTAIENVAKVLMINGVPGSAALPHAAEWLRALGLPG